MSQPFLFPPHVSVLLFIAEFSLNSLALLIRRAQFSLTDQTGGEGVMAQQSRHIPLSPEAAIVREGSVVAPSAPSHARALRHAATPRVGVTGLDC